jgi:hypothetical protein
MVEEGTRALRLSYGYEDIPRLVEAIDHMADAAATVSRQATG